MIPLLRALSLSLLCLVTTMFILNPTSAAADDERDRVRYGGEWYEKYRQITYWGRVLVSVNDYHYSSGDATYLELVVDETKPGKHLSETFPRLDIRAHFFQEFRRFFGDLPYHDLEKGSDERYTQFMRGVGTFSPQAYERFQAAEEARRRSLYGGRAGAMYCHVRVKRRQFPVLYDIRCSMSAKDDLSYSNGDEVRDIGYSSPEHIAGEIKVALTEMLKERSIELAKMRRYGRK